MKIAVVGCGAMGSVYAGLLGSAGNPVLAVDRWPEHVQAIRARGLRVEGASGDRTVAVAAELVAPRQLADQGVHALGVVVERGLGHEKVLSRTNLDHIGSQGPGTTGETDQRQ